MRKLLLVVFLLLPVSSFATTLEITSGTISSYPELRDSFYGFGGFGFSGAGYVLGSTYIGGTSWVIGFSGGGAIPTQFNVDGFSPCLPFGEFQSCGSMKFAIAPLPTVGDPSTYLAIVPFSATGHILVGDNCNINAFQPPACPGFDIAGDGFLTMRYQQVPNFGFQPLPVFAFVAPELSSLALLPLGLIGIVMAGKYRKRMVV